MKVVNAFSAFEQIKKGSNYLLPKKTHGYE